MLRLLMVLGLVSLGLTALPRLAIAETRILVLGDSILTWNRTGGNAIPQLLDRQPGFSATSRASPGAVFSDTPGLRRLIQRDIPAQLPPGTWDVIVVNGGGNDLARKCGCAPCDATLDTLVAADGKTGEIPAFLDLLYHRGRHVIWLDYFPVSVRGGPFAPCIDALATLETRMELAAGRRSWVSFVDAGDVYDRRDMSLYARDLIHPTPKGSARIAGHLLREILTRTP